MSSKLFEQLKAFADDIDGQYKSAAGDEPPSDHPTAAADNGTVAQVEGAHGRELSEQIKATVPTGGVDSKPESISINQLDNQLNVGTKQTGVGQDPATEDDYKDRVDDPPTTSPMKADDGVKYSNWNSSQLRNEATKKANLILAQIATKSAGAPKAAARRPETDAIKAAEAGYQAAAVLGNTAGDAKQRALPTLQNTIKEAEWAAQLTADYLTSYSAQLKRAEDGDDDGDEPETAPAPPDAGAPEAGGPSGTDMMAALAPGGGGPDPAAAAGGAGPEASPAEAVHELAAAMVEMGVSPEELLQAYAEQVGGAGGDAGPGGPPPEGAMPGGPPMGGDPKMAADMQLMRKIAQNVKTYRRSGQFAFGPPKTARQQNIRAAMRKFVSEIVR